MIATFGLRFSRIMRQRVLELDEPAQREVLALHGHDHVSAATSALIVSRPSDGGVSMRM